MSNIIIHHRSAHHAQNSGYGQLADYIDSDTLPYLTSTFPYKIAKWIANLVSNKSGIYDTMSIIKDYELSKLILFKNGKGIIHYLNGERDVRFGIRLNKLKNNYKFIATFHKPPEVLSATFDTTFFKKLDGAIAVGENQVDFLKKWLNIDNVCYIPHGIDTHFFVPNNTIKEKNTILFVGQHLRDFDALNYVILKLKSVIPSLKVNVVLRNDFAKNIHPNSCVTIHSGINDEELRTLYQKSSLLFLPLLNSTACNSILEAMACGLPIVSTDVGGNRGYVKDDFGFLLASKNYQGMADLIVELLADMDRLAEMGSNARNYAQGMDWIIVAKQVEDFYVNLNRHQDK